MITTECDAFERHSVMGFPTTEMWDVVSKFFAIIFNSMNMLGAHAVALPYKNADSDSPILTCAAELPRDTDSLMKYAKDY